MAPGGVPLYLKLVEREFNNRHGAGIFQQRHGADRRPADGSPPAPATGGPGCVRMRSPPHRGLEPEILTLPKQGSPPERYAFRARSRPASAAASGVAQATARPVRIRTPFGETPSTPPSTAK